MKNSLFYCLLTFLVLASCNLKNENKSIAVAKTLATSQITDTLPCFSGSQIYHETAYLWQASWATYNNEIGNGNAGEPYTNSPQLNFEEHRLNALQSEVVNAPNPGVLLWYILLNENDTIPSLAMQNTVSCIIYNQSTILVAHLNGNPNSIISPADLEIYKQNWSDAGEKNLSVHTKVYGYNYSWVRIQEYIDADRDTSGIFVSYGLRTIVPDEIGYDVDSLTNKTGSVIYCNVMYGNEDEENDLSYLGDFALPCPTYCGELF